MRRAGTSEGPGAPSSRAAPSHPRVLTCAPLVQRGIRHLRTLHLSSHRERKLLLQQQKDIVSVQRSAALLQQELQDQTLLPQVGILTWPGGLARGRKCCLLAASWARASPV